MFAPIGTIPHADVRPAGWTARSGAAVLVAPAAVLFGTVLEISYILTPSPPISLKERDFTRADGAVGWVSVFQVVDYEIPASAGSPARIAPARHILTRITAVGIGGSATIAVRALNAQTREISVILPAVIISATDFTELPLQQAVFGSQDVLQVQVLTGEVSLVVSYVKATQERFEVIP
jgi:hypothetical protein